MRPGVRRVPFDRLDVEISHEDPEVLNQRHDLEEGFDRSVGHAGGVVYICEGGRVAAEAAGECEEQSVGLGVNGGVEGELKLGESASVDVGADLGFEVSVKAVNNLPCCMDGGPDDVVPFF